MSFPAVFNLTNLNGINGFAINGINAGDQSGGSVASAGDINGDGVADVIIGALYASPNGNLYAGQSYVIFGSKKGFVPQFNLKDLNGNNGFVINGINSYDQSGYSVSGIGDVNGDEIADVIIGAPGEFQNIAGQSYVIFGSKEGFAPQFNLTTLNGTNGFTINGINAGDQSGGSVASAGDINGDGIFDIVIGAWQASPDGNNLAGQSYIIFGSKEGFIPQFNLADLNGTNGFAINGINFCDISGDFVSGAGDVNNDGITDVIIGAPLASPNGNHWAGQSYVIFGSKKGFAPQFNLADLNSINGFVINGINAGDQSGLSVSGTGDINADGIADIIIGAPGASYNGNTDAGQSYVIYGSKFEFPTTINSTWLNGQNGFTINGINAGDQSGVSISGAGDVNNDGIADVIIGAYYASPNGTNKAGQSYVIFGSKEGFASQFNLANLNGVNGFVINGINAEDSSGVSVASAGDINGDGIADVIIGAWIASTNGNNLTGQSYIIFGQKSFIDHHHELTGETAENFGDVV